MILTKGCFLQVLKGKKKAEKKSIKKILLRNIGTKTSNEFTDVIMKTKKDLVRYMHFAALLNNLNQAFRDYEFGEKYLLINENIFQNDILMKMYGFPASPLFRKNRAPLAKDRLNTDNFNTFYEDQIQKQRFYKEVLKTKYSFNA